MGKWITVLCVIAIAGNASAQSLSASECERLGSLAASAVQNRAQGVEKSEMAAALPSLDQPEEARITPQYRLLQAMYEILNEVFDHESLNRLAYMVYKTEACLEEITKGVAPRPFDQVRPELLKCSELESSDQIIECSMKTAGATEEGA